MGVIATAVLLSVGVASIAAFTLTRGGSGGSSAPSSRTSKGITAERAPRGVGLFEGAINAVTPWSNDLKNAMGASDFRVETTEAEAAYLGSWWALADWCQANGQGRTGVCYDLASEFLRKYFQRDPRTVNSKTWGRPGAVGGLIDSGYTLTNRYLGVNGPPVASDKGRPGIDLLCEPSCEAVVKS